MISSRFPNYGTALRYLLNINKKIKAEGILAPNTNSISNTLSLYHLIGKPLDSIPTIHIGGTNGKGTTCYKMTQALIHSGMKTGLFVSPHIYSFRERIQINNQLISQEDFMVHLEKVLSLCETHSIPATQFEITFIMACLQYEAQKCDAVVLEVGCGGEWDATNVILSSLSIVCSVGLDHMRILGNTVELIAANKAGIFRPSVPALIGPGCPYDVMKEVAINRNTPLYQLSSNDYNDQPHVQEEDTDHLNSRLTLTGLSLLKDYMASTTRNFSSEILQKFSILNLDNEELRNIIFSSRPPCRWQEIEHHRHVFYENQNILLRITIILDIAHNQPAIEALMKKVKSKLKDKNVRLLYGMSRDKDVESCLNAVGEVIPINRIHFVQSNNFRAISVDILQNILLKISQKNTSSSDQMQQQHSSQHQHPHHDDYCGTPSTNTNTDHLSPLESALQLLTSEALTNLRNSSTSLEIVNGGILLVCGSGYIMSSITSALGIFHPNDHEDLETVLDSPS